MSDVDHVNGESCDLWSTPGEDAEEEEDEDEEEKRSSSCSRDAEEKMKMIQVCQTLTAGGEGIKVDMVIDVAISMCMS